MFDLAGDGVGLLEGFEIGFAAKALSGQEPEQQVAGEGGCQDGETADPYDSGSDVQCLFLQTVSHFRNGFDVVA